jgi:hypothetical protein
MIGPLTTTPGDFTHVLVAIDKFTKRIKYKPTATLTTDRLITFIYDILHRFGSPNTSITDLGSNFHSHQFWGFCECSSFKAKYVLVAHLRANGQVECANSLILISSLAQKRWQVDQWDLISSLGLRTTTKQSHRPVTFLSRIQV